MKVKVLFFGSLAEDVSSCSIDIENVFDLEALKNHLYTLYPSLSNSKFSISVNKKFEHQNVKLQHGDEIACLPPFSGG